MDPGGTPKLRRFAFSLAPFVREWKCEIVVIYHFIIFLRTVVPVGFLFFIAVAHPECMPICVCVRKAPDAGIEKAPLWGG